MIEINTKDLKIGMYIAQLDRPWLETSFLFQGFLIENADQIKELQHFCKTVKVNEEQSAHSISFAEFKPSPGKQNTAQAASIRTTGQPHPKSHFEEEMTTARNIYEDTSVSLNKVLNNFRLNNYIAVPDVKSCVQKVVGNVIHNPHALVLLSNLRSKRPDTITHSINICIVATLFGRHLGFNHEQLSSLSLAALLHDAGEIKLPKAILEKSKDDLTAEEKAQIEMHTQYGAEILSKIDGLPAEAAEAAYSHHEKINGKGYPRGLQGNEISLVSRIIAIVDEYEKLTNNANSRIQLSSSDALKSIFAMSDTLLDAKLVESFIKCLGIYPVGSAVQLSSGAIAIVIGIKPDKHLLPTVMIIRDKNGEIPHPPQVINLDNFRDHDGRPLLLISKGVDPSTLGFDLSDYIVRELGVKVNSSIKLG